MIYRLTDQFTCTHQKRDVPSCMPSTPSLRAWQEAMGKFHPSTFVTTDKRMLSFQRVGHGLQGAMVVPPLRPLSRLPNIRWTRAERLEKHRAARAKLTGPHP